MARSRFEDLLQSHRFWLVDVMPSATFPFFVLGSPSYAFQSITAPEINLETKELAPVNSMFKKHVYSGGSVGPITLTRGCTAWDGTFYEWVRKGITGFDMVNRDLLLIHYTGIGIEDDGIASAVAAALTGNVPAAFGVGPDAGDIAKLPGRAWMLWNVIPTRYKVASDFDATSGEVSLMELDIQASAISEFVLA